MAEIIKQNYIVAASSEWTAEMVPLIAADFQGIAEQFAQYWTKETYRIFQKPCQAGVYDGKTGILLTGYRNGERVNLQAKKPSGKPDYS